MVSLALKAYSLILLVTLLDSSIAQGEGGGGAGEFAERCINSDVRLVGGQSELEGRVEVCVDQEWATVCDDLWDSADAAVVCRQLGFATEGANAFQSAPFGPGTGLIGLDDVACSGTETMLTDCTARTSTIHIENHNCGHDEDAGVSCTNEFAERCNNSDVRLVGGRSELEGRVEVCVDQEWATVCSDLWDIADAEVVCRQLGFGTEGANAFQSAPFGPGTGLIGLDDVACSGTETMLTDCTATTSTIHIENHNCGHDEDAGVSCPNVPSTTSSSSPLNLTEIILIAVGGLVFVSLILICCVVIVCCKRKPKRKQPKARMMTRQEDMIGLVSRKESDLKLEMFDKPESRYISRYKHSLEESELHDLIISITSLKLLNVIGEGEFGMVYKTQYLDNGGGRKRVLSINSNNNNLFVAVKIQKESSNNDEEQDILNECKFMKDCDHPNVLTILGICVDAGPTPYVVMPFMSRGCLRSYLKEHGVDLMISSNEPNEDKISTARKRLLDMCLQVSKGMEYLAMKNVIHRDLAARNCMIDDSWIIKVADFGLSKNTGAKDYIRQDETSGAKLLPVKWMAMESLEQGVFSEKTDVWSFGVTMWEVFTAGKNPYNKIHPMIVIRNLNEGIRLEIPENGACNDRVFSIMKDCWLESPDERPKFAEIRARLSSLIESMSDYLEVMAFANT